MNKNVLIIVIIIAIVVVVAGISFFSPQASDTQIIPENTNPQLVGGDKDAHGCIGSAGYSWCEVKSKCLRVWEEKCQ